MHMQDIETRADQAESLWAQGDAALSGNDLGKAYLLFTQAHDLVTDCARLHERAHQKLITVTRLHSSKSEFMTDWALLVLAPLGIFHLIALAFRTRVGASRLCRGRA